MGGNDRGGRFDRHESRVEQAISLIEAESWPNRGTHLRRTILIPLLLYSDNDAVVAEEEGRRKKKASFTHSLGRHGACRQKEGRR